VLAGLALTCGLLEAGLPATANAAPGGTVSSEQKVKVPIGTELPASIFYAHSHKHLALGDGVARQVG
jgi:hypothetical protein